jgi:hypothetical protein
MNRLKIVFLKNFDLKMQKISAFSNRSQFGTFLKTQNFKR